MIRVAGIADDSIVDGPGIRVTVFGQGCPHHHFDQHSGQNREQQYNDQVGKRCAGDRDGNGECADQENAPGKTVKEKIPEAQKIDASFTAAELKAKQRDGGTACQHNGAPDGDSWNKAQKKAFTIHRSRAVKIAAVSMIQKAEQHQHHDRHHQIHRRKVRQVEQQCIDGIRVHVAGSIKPVQYECLRNGKQNQADDSDQAQLAECLAKKFR